MAEDPNVNQPQEGQTQQPETPANPPSWLKVRLQEEREKGAREAREAALKELEVKNASAIRLAKLLEEGGHDPNRVADDYEREVRAAQAKQAGMSVPAYQEVEDVRKGLAELKAEQAATKRLLHEQKLNAILAQAEAAFFQSEPRAREYAAEVQQRMGFAVARYADTVGTLPTVDELVNEAKAAFWMSAGPKLLQQQGAAASASAQATQQYRDTHQALVPTSGAVEPQLPRADWRQLTMSNDPKDQALVADVLRAAETKDEAAIAKYKSMFGF
ncbi:MAG: hypothetical protein KGL39_37025 [Patescibacteria group bacterium]|nr:hypothetical protein [Patescibacteria group bacterium]